MQATSRSRRVSRPSRFHRREDGQAALEFLLVLPMFILFLLLLVDMGFMMYEYVSVANAVREGARFGAVNCGDGSCTSDEVQARAIARSGGLLSDPGEVSVSWLDNNGDGTNRGRGDSVVVSITHPYAFIFFPSTVPVVSCADMRLEQVDGTASLPSGSGC